MCSNLNLHDGTRPKDFEESLGWAGVVCPRDPDAPDQGKDDIDQGTMVLLPGRGARVGE